MFLFLVNAAFSDFYTVIYNQILYSLFVLKPGLRSRSLEIWNYPLFGALNISVGQQNVIILHFLADFV